MVDILKTPVGRIVTGSLHEGSSQTWQGGKFVERPLKADGTKDFRWFIGLAIPKTDPEWNAVNQMLIRAAQAGNPCMVGANGEAVGDFSWKVIDGDSTIPNENKKIPCKQEGYPGHWILGISSNFPFVVWNINGEVIPANTVPCGHYIRAGVSAKPNNKSGKQAGVYVNSHGFEYAREGTIIHSGPSHAEVFGNAPGATASPPPAAAAAAPPPPPPPPPPPDPEFAATESPPPAGYRMTGGLTYAKLIAAGWTDAQMVQQGHMVAG